jgi:paraquat-inducible protein B
MTTAQPEIRKDRAFNPIWLIPALAVVLGVWMVVHSWMTEGPEIQIAFETAEGLTAGKTKIKYRNVVMGLVQEVILTDDFEGVIAKVKLERQALPLLRDDTRFWVVTARISLGNVSGLDTLLSGAYIKLSPGDGKVGQRQFTGLEEPPLTPQDAPGLRLELYGDHAGSVGAGDSVVYKGYKVGRVESMSFDPDRRQVKYVIFIDAPFHELIDSSVRFYNISGITVSAGAEGLQVTTGSIDTVLLGGVTFGTPPGIPKGEPVEHNAEFFLYRSKEAANDNPYKYGLYFVVRFSQSLKGLLPGAPVEYRGIPIGRVERLMIKEMVEEGIKTGRPGTGEPIPVLIYVEPARLELPDLESSVVAMRHTVATGVANGMRATLETGNLLTGAKYIGMDYFKGVETASIGEWDEYAEIPTISGGFGQIMVQVTALLDKFNAMPLDKTVTSANSAIAELDKTLASLRVILEEKSTQELPGELNATLAELRAVLDGLSPDSAFYQNLNATLQQLNRTLGNVESLTRTLSGQPNAAIMPSKLPPDPIPEARR